MSTIATARSQGADYVLDPDCIPLTLDDPSLFEQKMKLILSVSVITLQTDRGKKFVRELEEYFNDQLVCSKSHGFHENSVGYRVNVLNMLSCMSSAKFKYLKGASESFIINWQA